MPKLFAAVDDSKIILAGRVAEDLVVGGVGILFQQFFHRVDDEIVENRLKFHQRFGSSNITEENDCFRRSFGIGEFVKLRFKFGLLPVNVGDEECFS